MRKRPSAYIQSRRTRTQLCPKCGHVIDATTRADLDGRPSAPDSLLGQLGCCVYCAAVFMFTTADGMVRLLSGDEEKECLAQAEPHMVAYLEQLRLDVRERADSVAKVRVN